MYIYIGILYILYNIYIMYIYTYIYIYIYIYLCIDVMVMNNTTFSIVTMFVNLLPSFLYVFPI